MTHDEMARFAVQVLAQHSARKAVRDHLLSQGVKLSYVPAREIVAQAKAWLREHPEVIVEGRAKAEALGYGGKAA